MRSSVSSWCEVRSRHSIMASRSTYSNSPSSRHSCSSAALDAATAAAGPAAAAADAARCALSLPVSLSLGFEPAEPLLGLSSWSLSSPSPASSSLAAHMTAHRRMLSPPTPPPAPPPLLTAAIGVAAKGETPALAATALLLGCAAACLSPLALGGVPGCGLHLAAASLCAACSFAAAPTAGGTTGGTAVPSTCSTKAGRYSFSPCCRLWVVAHSKATMSATCKGNTARKAQEAGTVGTLQPASLKMSSCGC